MEVVDDCVIFVVVCSGNASWYVDVEILRELEIQSSKFKSWRGRPKTRIPIFDDGTEVVLS
jgi:hypothetical protein